MTNNIELFTIVRNGAIRYHKTLKNPTKSGTKLLVDFVNFIGKENGVNFNFKEESLNGSSTKKKSKISKA